jgi:hypothetical protein
MTRPTLAVIGTCAALFALGGCTTNERTVGGAAIGGVGGAVVGNAVGGTGGAVVGGLAGGTAGAVIGRNSGRRY